MNRTDRLLAIVLELQRHKHRRAEDLAATFEVTKRTIYRDIQALSVAGVPIIAETGWGYSLVEGYFLPPLSFSTDEALMLILGSDFMAQNFDAQYQLAAQAARHKIEAVLPEALRADVEYLQENIRFIRGNIEDNFKPLLPLRRAIIERKRVRFEYFKRADNETASHREVDPYALAHHGGAWYLIGYCHLRKGIRNFRLSRIERLTVLNLTFSRPSRSTWHKPIDDGRNLVIRILLDDEAARWLKEMPSFYVVGEKLCADGLLVTLRVRHERDVLQWLLSWGSHIRVIEPESLRQLLLSEVEKMQRNLLSTSKLKTRDVGATY